MRNLTFNPDEFKRMIEEAEPALKGLFDQLYAGTNINIEVLLTAWHTTHPPRDDKYCDFEGCTELCEVGCILICGHAYYYHFECFLFKLDSQCKYCTDYFVSEIEKNCRIFHEV